MKAATKFVQKAVASGSISIHAAREGGDATEKKREKRGSRFQSTPPVKAATEAGVQLFVSLIISIHAAREGGDLGTGTLSLYEKISIHAAREGGDV